MWNSNEDSETDKPSEVVEMVRKYGARLNQRFGERRQFYATRQTGASDGYSPAAIAYLNETTQN